jgi:hypothetical protein
MRLCIYTRTQKSSPFTLKCDFLAVIVESGRCPGRNVCVASAAEAAQLYHIGLVQIVTFAAKIKKL